MRAPILALAATFAAVTSVSPTDGQTFSDCNKCPQMISIAPGAVSAEYSKAKKKSQWIVVKQRYALSKFEITRGQYAAFISATGYKTEPCLHKNGRRWELSSVQNWTNPGFKQGNDEPVACISRGDALSYTKWLSHVSGKSYRLPLENEWIYAATGKEGSFPFSKRFENHAERCKYANTADKALKQKYPNVQISKCTDYYIYTAPIGRFKPNGFGLHDMLGNVSEWIARSNKNGADIARGGSWIMMAGAGRSAYRFRNSTKKRYSDIGFRVARTLSK